MTHRPLRHVRVLIDGPGEDVAALIECCCTEGLKFAIETVDDDRHLLSFTTRASDNADVKLVVKRWHDGHPEWVERWNNEHPWERDQSLQRAELSGPPAELEGMATVHFLSRYEYYAVYRGRELFPADATTERGEFKIEWTEMTTKFIAAWRLTPATPVVTGPLCDVSQAPATILWQEAKTRTARTLREQLVKVSGRSEGGTIAAWAGRIVYLGLLSFAVTALVVGLPLGLATAGSRSTGVGPVLAIATMTAHLLGLLLFSLWLPLVRIDREGVNRFIVRIGRREIPVAFNQTDQRVRRGPVSWLCGLEYIAGGWPWAGFYPARPIRSAVSNDEEFAAGQTAKTLMPEAHWSEGLFVVELLLVALAVAAFVLLTFYRW